MDKNVLILVFLNCEIFLKFLSCFFEFIFVFCIQTWYLAGILPLDPSLEIAKKDMKKSFC